MANIFFYSDADRNIVLIISFEQLFFLHPFTTYITILLHMQAELILKFWYRVDGSNRQQKAAILHSSVSAGVQVLLFGLNSWVGYQHRHRVLWWPLGWQFPNFVPHHDYILYFGPSFHTPFRNALVWISCYLIAYHVVAFGVSLRMKFRATRSHDAAGAAGPEITLEDRV